MVLAFATRKRHCAGGARRGNVVTRTALGTMNYLFVGDKDCGTSIANIHSLYCAIGSWKP